MNMLFKIVLSGLLMQLIVPAQATDLNIGEIAPGFTLPGVESGFHSLDSLAGEKGTVVVFTCNHCPFAKAYQGRIKNISRDYKDKGINLIAINPNDAKEYPTDNYAHMIKRAKAENYNFPYLRDRTQKTAVNYGAVVTPHVFLLDKEKRLYYKGPIDDSWKDPDKAESLYLRDAINAMLAGEKIANGKIRPMGCSIKWLEARGIDVTPYQIAEDAEQNSVIRLKFGDFIRHYNSHFFCEVQRKSVSSSFQPNEIKPSKWQRSLHGKFTTNTWDRQAKSDFHDLSRQQSGMSSCLLRWRHF